MPRSELNFGVVLPQGWRWLDQIQSGTAIQQYEFTKNIAQISDFLEYDSAYVYDHLWGGAYFKRNRTRNFFECFTLLSAISTYTKRLKIGQVVTCNSYRNPSLLAKMLSTMDVISNGRIELGIGAGWYKEEYKTYGYAYSSDKTRIQQLDESLSIIKSMWTSKRASFSGQFFSIREAICSPKPIQKPHPTIMVGGTGEKYLLKVAAKHADRYNHPFGSPHDLKRKISALNEHCTILRRDHREIQISVLIRCLIRESEDEIYKQINKWKKPHETIEQFIRRIDSQAVMGCPDQIISKIHEYIDLGVTHFIIQFIGLNEHTLRLFHSMVIKKL